MADAHHPFMHGLSGFHSVTWLHNDKAGHYGSFSLWATKQDAEAAGTVAGLQLDDTTKSLLKGRPSVQIFEVAEVTD